MTLCKLISGIQVQNRWCGLPIRYLYINILIIYIYLWCLCLLHIVSYYALNLCIHICTYAYNLLYRSICVCSRLHERYHLPFKKYFGRNLYACFFLDTYMYIKNTYFTFRNTYFGAMFTYIYHRHELKVNVPVTRILWVPSLCSHLPSVWFVQL